MSTVYDDVVKFAKQIKTEKSEGKKWIYVKNGKANLITYLPSSYYQKTNILIVDDPIKYLKAINKREPTQQELDQFTFVGEIIPLIETNIEQEEVYLPNELWEITIMNKPIKEILEMRTLSKEWRDRIDSIWCRLIERDFNTKEYNKNDCYNEYKFMYKFKGMPSMSTNEIQNIITDLELKDIKVNDIVKLFEMKGFKLIGNKLYFDPQIVFNTSRYLDYLEANVGYYSNRGPLFVSR